MAIDSTGDDRHAPDDDPGVTDSLPARSIGGALQTQGRFVVTVGHDTLRIDDISVAYGRNAPVIESFSVKAIHPGRLVAVLGPNGSGKSSLLKALGGLLRPVRGRIQLGALDLTHLPSERRARELVYLPQSLPDAVHLRVFEALLVAARLPGLGGSRSAGASKAILRLLDELGMSALAMRYLDQLSGGQKQMVGLAQALIRKPRVLLLDEPLSALDLNYQVQVMGRLIHETRSRQLITLIILHDLNAALQYCDDALLIQSGRLIAQGAPAEVITPQALRDVYRVRGRVETSLHDGRAHVMIDGAY